MHKPEKPLYSTWIRKKKIVTFWAIFTLFFLSGIVGSFLFWPLVSISVLSLPFLFIAIIITRTAYLFSEAGGDFQNKIHKLLISHLPRDESVLDIGCGSGNLLVKIAKDNPSIHRGIDYWGDDWEYSKSQCEKNANIEGLRSLSFEKASASKLPIESGTIANIVSCLTFHEVGDVADKTDCLKEAMRVLKLEGTFVLFDLFADPKFYPDYDAIARAIEATGAKIEFRQKLSEIMPLPYPLNTPRVLRFAEIVVGRKLR